MKESQFVFRIGGMKGDLLFLDFSVGSSLIRFVMVSTCFSVLGMRQEKGGARQFLMRFRPAVAADDAWSIRFEWNSLDI